MSLSFFYKSVSGTGSGHLGVVTFIPNRLSIVVVDITSILSCFLVQGLVYLVDSSAITFPATCHLMSLSLVIQSRLLLVKECAQLSLGGLCQKDAQLTQETKEDQKGKLPGTNGARKKQGRKMRLQSSRSIDTIISFRYV